MADRPEVLLPERDRPEVTFLLAFLLWLFAPTMLVVLIAIVLSVLGFKPPKHHPGQDSWFK